MAPTSDVRDLPDISRLRYLRTALFRAAHIARNLAQGDVVFAIYAEMLKYVVQEKHGGACHETSAVLHVLLREQGVESSLCIGEVRAREGVLDHSWVEIERDLFDVAVCLPQETIGVHVGGPVFRSWDLATGAPTTLQYGVQSSGLWDEAQRVRDATLDQYADLQREHYRAKPTVRTPATDIWMLAARIAHDLGMRNSSPDRFRTEYGNERRCFRS